MIDKFEGNYRFLSNFWECSAGLEHDLYPSVEHAYQAAKTLDPIERLQIRNAATAREAKKLGKKVMMRMDWEYIKLPIMEVLVYEKFKNHGALRNSLLATGDQELVEGNWWGDTFWGVCNGIGENHLGKILMKVRNELRGRRMAVVIMDFDGTLVNGDKMIPGAKEAVNLLREKGHRVVIDSCNNSAWIKRVLDNNDVRYDRITADDEPKPIGDLYIDDKAFHFRGNWEAEVVDVMLRLEGLDNRKW